MPKLYFQNRLQNAHDQAHPPKRAIQMIPDWYKNLSPYLNGEKKVRLFRNGQVNMSIKKCIPVLDAMGAGYLLTLPADVVVDSENFPYPEFTWRTEAKLISEHHPDQIGGFDVSPKFDSRPYKWVHNWQIEAPKGYSLLFTHPLNKPDLPFYTMSGIVDADKFKLPVQLPFFVEKNFNGIIEAGTPIAQVIPIKRQNWSSQILKPDETLAEQRQIEFRSKISGYYKKLAWHRKSYE